MTLVVSVCSLRVSIYAQVCSLFYWALAPALDIIFYHLV